MRISKTLTRIFVKDIEPAIKFYEELFVVKANLRFVYEEKKLELASVGDVLILAGEDEDLAPFKETKLTFLVDSVEDFKLVLLEKGATVIRDITKVPTGLNMTLRHTDGTVAEYVQHTM